MHCIGNWNGKIPLSRTLVGKSFIWPHLLWGLFFLYSALLWSSQSPRDWALWTALPRLLVIGTTNERNLWEVLRWEEEEVRCFFQMLRPLQDISISSRATLFHVSSCHWAQQCSSLQCLFRLKCDNSFPWRQSLCASTFLIGSVNSEWVELDSVSWQDPHNTSLWGNVQRTSSGFCSPEYVGRSGTQVQTEILFSSY